MCRGTLALEQTPEHFAFLCALGELKWKGKRMPLAKSECIFLPAQMEPNRDYRRAGRAGVLAGNGREARGELMRLAACGMADYPFG